MYVKIGLAKTAYPDQTGPGLLIRLVLEEQSDPGLHNLQCLKLYSMVECLS